MAENIFNERIAARYDEADRRMFENHTLTPAVEFLANLANGGEALEFAVGTGRVALPLHQRGVSVHGIELSKPMVDQMRSKPGASQIPVTVGDMATTKLAHKFQLVYLVYNTITNLITQDEQVACFCNAANHLEKGGCFVIEVQVPAIQKLVTGETLAAFDATPEHVGIDEYDRVRQIVVSHHYWMKDGQVEAFDSTHRYAWPAEYDLMARIAGLTLDQRWANWNRGPFTSESTSHISVWRKTMIPERPAISSKL